MVVCIIGPQWLELLQERARTGEKDYVRIELEETLKHNKLITPICILGAEVPRFSALPDTLKPIFDKWNVARMGYTNLPTPRYPHRAHQLGQRAGARRKRATLLRIQR
ncbi:MAG: hypothetical protein CUN55_00195 [Phototrophicales bacterium]|nr:MAG: hypothetical protein CUN55_00195 [Phototrophicales bacterium]